MKLLAALTFAVWFALRDVWRPAGRYATLVCAANIVVLTAAALLGLGILAGLHDIERQHVLRDPLSLCLWIGNAGFSEERQKLADMDPLRTRLADRLGSTFRGCHPFQSKDLEFEAIGGGGSKTVGRVFRRTCAGRTIEAGDPYLESLHNVQEFNVPEGILVSVYMLKELGLDAAPADLSLVAPSGVELKIPIKSVFDNRVGTATGQPLRLPPGYDFVMPDAYLDKLRPQVENSEAQWVEIGPIPDDWAAPGKLPIEVKQVFTTLNLSGPYKRERQSVNCWRIESHDSPPPRMLQWRLIAQRIAPAMRAADVRLQIIGSESAESTSAPASLEYERAALYVTVPQALEGAADEAEEFGLSVDREIVQKLKRVERNSTVRMAMLVALLVFLGASCLMNVSSIQALHVQRKIAAIGMLRAIGMSGRLLAAIYVVEPLLIGCAGFLAGWCIAQVAGRYLTGPLAMALDQTAAPGAPRLACHCTFFTTVATWACLQSLSIVASLLASRGARLSSPIQALQSG